MTVETAREVSSNPEVLKRLAKYLLSDEEMKALMIEVVNKTYCALIVLFDDRLGEELIKVLAQHDFLPNWNEPTLNTAD